MDIELFGEKIGEARHLRIGHVAVGGRHRHLETGLLHRAEHRRNRRTGAPSEQQLRFGRLDVLDLRRHRDVRGVEMLVGDDLYDALVFRRVDRRQQRLFGVLTAAVGAGDDGEPPHPAHPPIANRSRRQIDGRGIHGIGETAGLGVNTGRETVHHRAVILEQRRDRVAHRHHRGHEHHRRLAGQDVVGELHRGLRIGLIVVIDEFKRTALDAAVLVDGLLELIERLPLGRAEERAAARQRLDDVDFVRRLRLRRQGSQRQQQQAKRDSASHRRPPVFSPFARRYS